MATPLDDRELLERHKPLLRYDRQYDYRLASVLGMVENPGNLVRTADGEVIARSGGEPALTLAVLTAYPDGGRASPSDCLCQGPDPLGDARRMEGEPRYAGRLYGRVVRGGRRAWLQYWFWLYYNPKNLFGFGKHEGDWEMIQIGLGASGEPEQIDYAQHDGGETRKRGDVEWVRRAGGVHPVVYVAPLSHASYFEAGTHPYPIGIDHPYGDGPEGWLPVELFGEWVEWPGRWGNSERVVLGSVGNGPPAPSRQGLKWGRPAAFHRKLRRRALRLVLGRLMHALGRLTYPHAPSLLALVDGRRCIVEYRAVSSPLRRARHLYLTVHDGERVVGSRTVRRAGATGVEVLRLDDEPAQPAVWGSAFNRLRQRSDLARAELQP